MANFVKTQLHVLLTPETRSRLNYVYKNSEYPTYSAMIESLLVLALNDIIEEPDDEEEDE